MSRTVNAKKCRNKAPSWYKREGRQSDRARVKQAIREDRELMPLRLRDDTWNWN